MTGPAQGNEEFKLQGSWWQDPDVQTRHTCFIATFDSVTSNDADYVRGDSRYGGFGMNADVSGEYGQSTCIDLLGGHLHFNAKSNFDADRATRSVCRALVEIYRLSGDEKYLKPIAECLNWLKKDYPDGMYFFHDHKSGRSISAWRYKIAYLDEQAGRDRIRKQPLSSGYYSKRNIIPAIENTLANAERPANRMPEVIIKEIKNRLPKLRKDTARALVEQNEAGFWTPGSDVASYSMGPVIPTNSVCVMDILRYIEAVRMVIGKLSLKWRGEGKIGLDIYPKENWYDVGWY